MNESNAAAAIKKTMDLMQKWGILEGKTDNELDVIYAHLNNIATSAIHDVRSKCADVYSQSIEELHSIRAEYYTQK